MENINQARPISTFQRLSSAILGGTLTSAWAGRMICNLPISAGAAFGSAATVCSIATFRFFGSRIPRDRSPETMKKENWFALLNVVILSGGGDLACSATGVNLTGAQIAILLAAVILGLNAVANLTTPPRQRVPLDALQPEGVVEPGHLN